MMKYGWDEQSALGSSMQGQMFPIKTVLRKKNTGLGFKQTPAKISHFGAYDLDAVKFKPMPKAPNKNDIEKMFSADKRLEIKLRKELT